ncbi:MAG: hypothetical protein MIO88_04945 [Methanoregulaceae archaeon]|jgi:hypothetical protein|nr:hypothetical protein [Methanoregulaceae archaeon]
MTDKLCPFDKKPCIGGQCMVFREDSGTCSFLFTGMQGKVPPPSAARKTEDRSSSQRFSAHLFD